MPGALEGIRIVECTAFQQGPVAGMILGDLGADIIKVEERIGGDPGRGMMRIIGVQMGLSGRNFYFENNNRNKRSITLDLRKEKGREIFYKLIEKSDVFLTNFRMDALKRIGLDYETLSRYNPKLIYAIGTGWGLRGPDSSEPSADFGGIARSGIMTLFGEPDAPPQNCVPGLCDQMGAITLAGSVCAALVARERQGIGQMVDVSLLGSMIGLEGLILAAKTVLGQDFPRPSRSKARNPMWNYYRCEEDKWIVLSVLQPDRYWPAFCKVMGLEELEKDPRFEDMEVRGEHAEEMIPILDKVFATKPREEWMKLFKEADIAYTPLQTMGDLMNDPQVLANEYIRDFDHPVWGPTKIVSTPLGFSETPVSLRREAPEFGQHTEEILIDILGYSWDDIVKLKDEEVI